jgi:hypothetical protein
LSAAIDNTEILQATLKDRLAPDQSKGDGYSIMRQMDINEVREILSNPDVARALFAMILEYGRACRKWPNWPADDLVHAAAILCGEAGECLKAANHYREGRYTDGIDSLYAAECEAIQAGAMAMRFLVNLPRKGAQ